jgi:hypothetical protein
MLKVLSKNEFSAFHLNHVGLDGTVFSQIPIQSEDDYSYSANGSLVVHATTDETIAVDNVFTGERVLTIDRFIRRTVSFVVDSDEIVALHEGQIVIYSLDGTVVSSFGVEGSPFRPRINANPEHVVVESVNSISVFRRDGTPIQYSMYNGAKLVSMKYGLLLNGGTDRIVDLHGVLFDGLSHEKIILDAVSVNDLMVYRTLGKCSVYSLSDRTLVNTIDVPTLFVFELSLSGPIVRIKFREDGCGLVWNPFENEVSFQSDQNSFIQDRRTFSWNDHELTIDGTVIFETPDTIESVSMDISGVVLL